jgi:hypothetical protein
MKYLLLASLLLAAGGTAAFPQASKGKGKPAPPAAPQVQKRTPLEALDLVRRDALAWQRDAVLLQISAQCLRPEDADIAAGKFTQFAVQYASRAGCKPGEILKRVWSVQPAAIPVIPGQQVTDSSSSAPLSERFADARTILARMKEKGMKSERPAIDLANVAGRALWFTVVPDPNHYVCDALTGEFVQTLGAPLSISLRDFEPLTTSWKQAADAVDRDLKLWKVGAYFLSSFKAFGYRRASIDKELSLTHWEFIVSVDVPAPVTITYQVAHGTSAEWAKSYPPPDRSHYAPLSSWNLAGAGERVMADPGVQAFLSGNPKIELELESDPARQKNGEALLRIKDIEKGRAMDLLLDKKGALKKAGR